MICDYELFHNFADMISHCLKQSKLEKVVADSIKRHNFSKIIVALSGGADSVCLLSALKAVAYTFRHQPLTLIAAHCNFHLRGEESERDLHFAEQICEKLGVELIISHFNVPEYQSHHPGTSLEMACRELRYDWFRSLMKEHQADRIAVGHNADDNIETLFINLLRGSGTTGLRGMSPDSGTILRPLLHVHRKEIIAYLKEREIPYIVDSSNLSSDFRRNFLRNEVIPLLRTRWEGLDKALDRSISLICAENDVVEKSVADHLPGKGSPLLAEDVLSFPAPELLIRRYIQPLQPLTTTPAEILSAIRADKPAIRLWTLPGGTVTLRARKLYLTPPV